MNTKVKLNLFRDLIVLIPKKAYQVNIYLGIIHLVRSQNFA